MIFKVQKKTLIFLSKIFLYKNLPILSLTNHMSHEMIFHRPVVWLHLTLCIILRSVQYWNSSYCTLKYIIIVTILADYDVFYISNLCKGIIIYLWNTIPLLILNLSLPSKMLMCDESCWSLSFIFQVSATAGLCFIYFW